MVNGNKGDNDMNKDKRHGWEIVELPNGEFQWILR